MKYTIMGFSQKAAFDFKLDLTDLCILRWFVDFKDSGNMRYAIVDDEKYYWIFYKKLIEEIYVLYLGRDSIYRRLKKLCDAKVLKRKTIRYGGNYTYYTLGENYVHLIRFQPDKKISKAAQSLADSNQNIDDFYYDLVDLDTYNDSNSDHSYNNFAQNDDDFIHNSSDFTQNTNDFIHNSNDFIQDTNNFTKNSSELAQSTNDFTKNSNELAQNTNDFIHSSSELAQNTNDFTQNSSDFAQNTNDFIQNSSDFAQSTSNFILSLADENPSLTDESTEQIINPSNKSNKLISINETSAENFLSQLLYCLIKKNNPNFDVPDFKSWTKGFSVILKNDKRSLREVIDLLRWVHMQDDFWRSFVLSPWDLRKQYDKIVARKKYDEDKSQAKKQSSDSNFVGPCDVSQFDEI